MKKRVISALIIALICIPIIIYGGAIFSIAISIIAILAFKEMLSVRKNGNIPIFMQIIGVVCMLLLILNNIININLLFELNVQTLALVFLLLFLPTVIINNKNYKVEDAFYLAITSVFLGITFNLCITLFNESKTLFIWLILISCVTDMFALFGGQLIGKHKLTSISPLKTIEGSVIGTIVAVIIGTTYYVILIGNHNIITIIMLIIILSLIGQLGDLFFSLIKRENGVKDFSNLIPGHGGILDRIDSIIFILIAFVFAMQFL